MLTLIRSIARRLVAWCYAGEVPNPQASPLTPQASDEVVMTIPLEEVRRQIADMTGVPIEHVKLIAVPAGYARANCPCPRCTARRQLKAAYRPSAN